MVFDPTFHEISKEADELADLAGDDANMDAAQIDEGILAGDDESDLPPEGGQ